jgi:hypothetical protein
LADPIYGLHLTGSTYWQKSIDICAEEQDWVNIGKISGIGSGQAHDWATPIPILQEDKTFSALVILVCTPGDGGPLDGAIYTCNSDGYPVNKIWEGSCTSTPAGRKTMAGPISLLKNTRYYLMLHSEDGTNSGPWMYGFSHPPPSWLGNDPAAIDLIPIGTVRFTKPLNSWPDPYNGVFYDLMSTARVVAALLY